MIRAIETSYKGYRFRSRLEARHAIFFDKMNIRWQYELEGYKVTHNVDGKEVDFSYLPDFYLPEFDMFVEVKGDLPPRHTQQELMSFSFTSRKSLIILIDSPSTLHSGIGIAQLNEEGRATGLITPAVRFFSLKDKAYIEFYASGGLPILQYYNDNSGWHFNQQHKEIFDLKFVVIFDRNGQARVMSRPESVLENRELWPIAPCKAARSARFEHGEKP